LDAEQQQQRIWEVEEPEEKEDVLRAEDATEVSVRDANVVNAKDVKEKKKQRMDGKLFTLYNADIFP